MTLRIISQQSVRSLKESGLRGVEVATILQDSYQSRLVKLLPAEAITAYPLFQAAAKASAGTGDGYYQGALVSWVLLVVVIVLRWRATKSPAGITQWPAILISAVSFIIWVFVLNGTFGFHLPQTPANWEFAAPLALFAWTTIAPAIYTGDSNSH